MRKNLVRNLLHDPKNLDHIESTVSARIQDHTLTIEKPASVTSEVSVKVTCGLPAQTQQVTVALDYQADESIKLALWGQVDGGVRELASQTSTVADGWQHVEFTAPLPATATSLLVGFMLQSDKDMTVSVQHVIVEDSSTFDPTLPFFDDLLMPLPEGVRL